jgi:hypothetical protein
VATSFYRNRGNDGTVNLNRLNTNVFMPTGLFCCEVPDVLNIIQRLCANISELEVNLYNNLSPSHHWHPGSNVRVQIRDNGATPSLGQSYSLTCGVTGTSDPVSSYQWRKDGTVLSETGQTLSLSPLSLSDAGQYTCQVSVDGMMLSRTQDIRLTS